MKKYPVMLNFTFYFRGRLLDTSNTSYMAKLIEDSLVKSRILEDDTPKFIHSVTLKSKKTKSKNNGVIVEIEEAREEQE